MKFTFTEKKLPLSDELRDYAEKKIGRLDRFFKSESDAYFTPSIERGRFKAEVTLRNNGVFYRVTEVTSDMYASIDSAVAAIERQIRKNKTRLAKKLKEGAFEQDAGPIYSDPADEAEEEFKIVRSKKFSMKPMSAEEAILQMNLLGHEFFAFRDQDNDEAFSIVYKRKNGDYGLLCDSDDN